MNTEMHKDLPVILATSFDNWVAWLKANGHKENGVWVKLSKKGSGVQSVTYEEAREGAIMYGWIDGLINAYDEKVYVTRFTPRRPKGLWSKINRTIAEQLIKEGRMTPTGLATVEAAQADGRWEAAYDSPSAIKIPKDFEVALGYSPKAQAFFESVSKTNRYAILYRIHTAHKPETRAVRIAGIIKMLEAGEVFHPKSKAE
jgi:uncharacterized protein YdeI (YjbR/CyaY-like superfamily)